MRTSISKTILSCKTSDKVNVVVDRVEVIPSSLAYQIEKQSYYPLIGLELQTSAPLACVATLTSDSFDDDSKTHSALRLVINCSELPKNLSTFLASTIKGLEWRENARNFDF